MKEIFDDIYSSKQLQKVFTSDAGEINFISWIYHRMKNIHMEDERVDFMLKLKEIATWVEENLM